VVVVRTRDALEHWLRDPSPGLQWIQVEGLLDDAEAWGAAARGDSDVPLDVALSDPASGFPNLYRLVDVLRARDVRVTMPAAPGFMSALRLAASLHLPVRLLPGQPCEKALAELEQAADFYLRDPMVEVPVEFFHSALTSMRGAPTGSLWRILEEDPAVFLPHDAEGNPVLPETGQPDSVAPADVVDAFLATLVEAGAECAPCRWQSLCRGYFKKPDTTYSCAGIVRILDRLRAAAEEIERDLAQRDVASSTPKPPSSTSS